MKSINQVRWRKGNGNPKDFKLLKTWNPNFGTYIKSNSIVFKKCVEEIYAKIFDGAKFPFEQEIYKKGDITVEKPSHIRIQNIDSIGCPSIESNTDPIQIK